MFYNALSLTMNIVHICKLHHQWCMIMSSRLWIVKYAPRVVTMVKVVDASMLLLYAMSGDSVPLTMTRIRIQWMTMTPS